MAHNDNLDIVSTVNALIAPERERLSRQLQDTFKAIRYRTNAKEWEVGEAVEKAVDAYVRDCFSLVMRSLEKTVLYKSARLTLDELKIAFEQLKPNKGEIQTFTYQAAGGLGIVTGVGFGLAIDDAYRQADALAIAHLSLLEKKEPPQMARSTNQSHALPTLSSHRAIELIEQQIARADVVAPLSYSDPAVEVWENTTEAILDGAFGRPSGEIHKNTSAFANADFGSHHVDMSDAEMQHNHRGRVLKQKALLEGFVEQIKVLAPPRDATAAQHYRFHPDIERCSGELFSDGHYKQAALEAYIYVIEAVKQKANLRADGDDLMNQAFGSDRRLPIIQVNSLQTDAERDEQKGFMFLFKGIVALRNSKAHSNRLFNDRSRAHEYLALSSVLLRILEISTTNRPA